MGTFSPPMVRRSPKMGWDFSLQFSQNGLALSSKRADGLSKWVSFENSSLILPKRFRCISQWSFTFPFWFAVLLERTAFLSKWVANLLCWTIMLSERGFSLPFRNNRLARSWTSQRKVHSSPESELTLLRLPCPTGKFLTRAALKCGYFCAKIECNGSTQ